MTAKLLGDYASVTQPFACIWELHCMLISLVKLLRTQHIDFTLLYVSVIRGWTNDCQSFLFSSGTSCVLDHLIAVAVNLGNFPRQRQGIVMGLLGCCLWLGQSFLLYLYTEIHSNSPGSLGLIFLVLGVWMFVIKGLGAVFVHPIPLEDDEAIPIIQCETTPQEEIQQPRVASESMSGEPIGNDKSHSRSQYFDLEVLRQTDFQLLLWGFVLGVATQYIFIGNLSIMATSLGLDSLYSLVAILSPIVTMMLSLLCGWLSDMTLELFPRATYLSVASLLQVLAYATAVVVGATRWAFTATTFLMYINNGLFFAMGGSLLAERFGSRYFKRHWGMIMMLAAAMAFIMLLIVGKLYQEACPTVPLTTPEGLQCFWGVYILGAFASAVSTYCFVMLQRHTIMAECRWLLNPSSGHWC